VSNVRGRCRTVIGGCRDADKRKQFTAASALGFGHELSSAKRAVNFQLFGFDNMSALSLFFVEICRRNAIWWFRNQR